MIVETYKGCKIKLTKGREYYSTRVVLNGVNQGDSMGKPEKVLTDIKATIDYAEQTGPAEARFSPEWYTPGTYELCPEGHVMPIGGPCGHGWCASQRPAGASASAEEVNEPEPESDQSARTEMTAITLSLPKPMDHQPKQPRRRTGKPGRFNSPARRAYTLARLVEHVNTGRVTVASYLTDLGADADTIRRYSATLGKHIKAAYQAKYCAEPVRNAIAVVGRRIVRAFGYDAGDIEILRAAVASYGRVSHLLNGAS